MNVSTILLVVTLSPDEQILAEATLDTFKAVGGQLSKQVQVVRLSNLPQHKLKHICCVVNLEVFAPFLSASLTADKFDTLRRFVTTGSKVGALVWMTISVHGIDVGKSIRSYWFDSLVAMELKSDHQTHLFITGRIFHRRLTYHRLYRLELWV